MSKTAFVVSIADWRPIGLEEYKLSWFRAARAYIQCLSWGARFQGAGLLPLYPARSRSAGRNQLAVHPVGLPVCTTCATARIGLIRRAHWR